MAVLSVEYHKQANTYFMFQTFAHLSHFVTLSNTLLIAHTLRAPTHRPACAGGLPAASGSVVVDVVSVLQTVVHSRVLEQGDEPVSSLCERREHANMRVTRTCWSAHQSGGGGRGGAHGRRLRRCALVQHCRAIQRSTLEHSMQGTATSRCAWTRRQALASRHCVKGRLCQVHRQNPRLAVNPPRYHAPHSPRTYRSFPPCRPVGGYR